MTRSPKRCAALLRRIQDHHKWTQTELAKALGWAQSKVSRRRNERGVPSDEDMATVRQLWIETGAP